MRSLALGAAACAMALGAAPAGAAPVLGLSIGTAVFPKLDTGTQSTPLTTLTITSLATPWTLTVSDANSATSTSPGHMLRQAPCTRGESALVSPLHIITSNVLGAHVDVADYTLGSGTSPTIADGSSTASLTAVYRQTIGSTDQLDTGCTYGITVLWTVS